MISRTLKFFAKIHLALRNTKLRASTVFSVNKSGTVVALSLLVKQLSLLREKKYAKRKVARAISLRGANHVVLKTNKHILRKNAPKLRALIRETQDRFGVKIRALSIMSNHVHLVIKVSNRKQFADGLRFLAGMIALKIAKTKLWTQRAWSRPLKVRKDISTTEIYVWNNAIKARCFGMIDTAYIVDGVLQI